MRRAAAALAGLTLVAANTACSAHGGSPLPAAPPTAEIRMTEYQFAFDHLSKGRVVFQVVNDGEIVHRMSLVPLPEDLPPIQQQLQGDERRALNTLAAVADVPPGGRGAVAVDLLAGRYAFICFLTDPDGQSHALKGMANEFRIR